MSFDYVRYVVEYEVRPREGRPFWATDMVFQEDEEWDARNYSANTPAKTRVVKVRGELMEEG